MSLGDINPMNLTHEEAYRVISGAFACYLMSIGMSEKEVVETMAVWCARVQVSLPGRPQ